MPGRRDRPPAPRVLPCGAASPAIPPSPAESVCALSEPACDIVFRPFIGRFSENLLRLVELDHFTQQEKAGELGHPRGLLHIMSDNDDSVLLFQLENQVFDFAARNWVEGRARLVHQQDFGLHSQGPGDAQTLLLSTRETGPGLFMQMVFNFVPQSGAVERAIDYFVKLFAIAEAVELESRRNVVVDRHRRKWIRFLEDHSHAPAQLSRRCSVIDAEIPDAHSSFHACVRNGLVHPVQTANKRGLPAAGGANQRGGMVRLKNQIDVEQGLSLAVEGIYVLASDSD